MHLTTTIRRISVPANIIQEEQNYTADLLNCVCVCVCVRGRVGMYFSQYVYMDRRTSIYNNSIVVLIIAHGLKRYSILST